MLQSSAIPASLWSIFRPTASDLTYPTKGFGAVLKKPCQDRGTDRVASRIGYQTILCCPKSPGLNFEAIKDRPGYFTIRVGRNFRILLKAEEDKDGPYYLLADIAPHDDTY